MGQKSHLKLQILESSRYTRSIFFIREPVEFRLQNSGLFPIVITSGGYNKSQSVSKHRAESPVFKKRTLVPRLLSH